MQLDLNFKTSTKFHQNPPDAFRYIDLEIEAQTNMQTDRQTDRHSDRQADRQTQTDR